VVLELRVMDDKAWSRHLRTPSGELLWRGLAASPVRARISSAGA
jgi:hypothetical protein